ncbi:hypothetical protein MHYP_G00078540 [Metynnis hypsauchen]
MWYVPPEWLNSRKRQAVSYDGSRASVNQSATISQSAPAGQQATVPVSALLTLAWQAWHLPTPEASLQDVLVPSMPG